MARKITNEKIIQVYEKKGCNVSATCNALGISRNALYVWRRKDKKLDEMMKDAEESIIDFAESKLIESINDGNMTAIIFFLKTKGRNRGYVERQEVDQINPIVPNFKIEVIDKREDVIKVDE